MRRIKRKTWPRREHFETYNAFDHAHFNICANMDITTFYPALKERDISFTVAIVYVLSHAANQIPEFRHRIRAGEVVEHEVVHPSITVLKDDDLFTFCTFDYADDFSSFTQNAVQQMAYAKEHPTLKDEPGQDDLLFMTAIPWISFTSILHPMHLNPADSIPRFAWGKFFQEGDQVKLPLSVQGHHALMDGLHMGRYYGKVQDYLLQPEDMLSGV